FGSEPRKARSLPRESARNSWIAERESTRKASWPPSPWPGGWKTALHAFRRGDAQQVERLFQLAQRRLGQRQTRGLHRRLGRQDRTGRVELREGLGQLVGVLGDEVRGLLVVGVDQGLVEGVQQEDQVPLGRLGHDDRAGLRARLGGL